MILKQGLLKVPTHAALLKVGVPYFTRSALVTLFDAIHRPLFILSKTFFALACKLHFFGYSAGGCLSNREIESVQTPRTY